jgi:hypothetical protein
MIATSVSMLEFAMGLLLQSLADFLPEDVPPLSGCGQIKADGSTTAAHSPPSGIFPCAKNRRFRRAQDHGTVKIAANVRSLTRALLTRCICLF